MKKDLETTPPVTPREPAEQNSSAMENCAQFASWEEHLEVEEKIFALHGELFRRLAGHDRQR